MAKFLWLNWDGGGNLPPSLGIACSLANRGHSVSFAGRAEMVPRVEAAGFRAIELKDAYTLIDKYPPSPIRRILAYLTSPAVGAEAAAVVRSEAPDVVLIDGMFPAALNEAHAFGRPTAVVIHTFFHRLLEGWRMQLERLNGARKQAGFVGLPSLDDLWMPRDLILVTTLAQFDQPQADVPGKVCHAGPVLQDDSRAKPAELPWPDSDTTRIVLVSFSTVQEQRMPANWQRTLDALADLPVHVVATTGAVVDPTELKAPRNAFVLSFAAHGPLMKRASLVITHGGHGTAMRALLHGVPMILMPALAHDQPLVAATIQEWGAGRALPSDASVDILRATASEVLAQSTYRENAQRLSKQLVGVDGAANAATALEGLLSR
jgi:MGT family glycosyltransferase